MGLLEVVEALLHVATGPLLAGVADAEAPQGAAFLASLVADLRAAFELAVDGGDREPDPFGDLLGAEPLSEADADVDPVVPSQLGVFLFLLCHGFILLSPMAGGPEDYIPWRTFSGSMRGWNTFALTLSFNAKFFLC